MSWGYRPPDEKESLNGTPLPRYGTKARPKIRMYQGTDYAATVERFRRFMITEGRNGLSPERLGQTVYTALTARHPKTSYTAIPQRLKNWSLPLSLPKRLVDKMIAKQLNLTLVRAKTRP
jgi:hypothetical protein